MKKEIWITLKNGKRIPLSLLKNKKNTTFKSTQSSKEAVLNKKYQETVEKVKGKGTFKVGGMFGGKSVEVGEIKQNANRFDFKENKQKINGIEKSANKYKFKSKKGLEHDLKEKSNTLKKKDEKLNTDIKKLDKESGNENNSELTRMNAHNHKKILEKIKYNQDAKKFYIDKAIEIKEEKRKEIEKAELQKKPKVKNKYEIEEDKKHAEYLNKNKEAKRLEKEYIANKKKWDVKEKDAIEDYTSDGFEEVNKGLRYNDKVSLKNKKETIENLDKSIEKYGSDLSGVMLYRGLKGEYMENYKVGDTYEEKGFMSTSINKSVSVDVFARNAGKQSLIRINSRKLKGLYISNEEQREYEAILPRNTKLKIVNIQKENGIIIYEMED